MAKKSIAKASVSPLAIIKSEVGAGSIDLGDFRSAYADKYSADTPMDDDAIMAMLAEHCTFGPEGADPSCKTGDGWAELMHSIAPAADAGDDDETDDDTGGEGVEVDAETAKIAVNATHLKAAQFASKAAGNADLLAELSAQIEREEKAKVAPLKLARLFRTVYSAEELALFPIVGSELDPKKPTNRPVDRYKYDVRDENNKKVPIRGSFFNDFADDLPSGKEIRKELDACAKISGAPLRSRQTKKFEGRQQSNRTVVKNAFRLIQAMDEIARISGGKVELYHDFDDVTPKAFADMKDQTIDHDTLTRPVMADGKPTGETEQFIRVYTSSKKPVFAGSTQNRKSFDHYAVSQIIGLDLEKFEAKGGNWDAFEAAMKREPNPDKNNEVPAVTYKNFVSFAAHMLNFLANQDNIDAIKRALTKAEADDLIVTLNDLDDIIGDDLLSDVSLSKGGKPSRLQTLLLARKHQQEQEKAAKAKASA